MSRLPYTSSSRLSLAGHPPCRRPIPNRRRLAHRSKCLGSGGGGRGAGRGSGVVSFCRSFLTPGIPQGGGGDDGDDPGPGRSPFRWISVATAGHASLHVLPAIGAEVDKVDEAVEDVWDWLGPLIGSVTFSSVLGFASGAALKYLGRRVAVAVGLVFLILQGMVYVGVVDIHWDRIEKKLDLTGDGKLDEDDFKGVPGVGGFAAGFLVGVKLG